MEEFKLEKRVAALEGGVAACAVGSGQAASAMCIQNLAQAGDNIVASTDLYGGTVNLFKNTLRQQGIEVRFADPADPKNFEKLTDDKTRAYYGESCPNPYLRVFPIKEVADIGRPKGIPLIIDNTASPVICEIAQIPNVKMYDGGMTHWTSNPKRKVDLG